MLWFLEASPETGTAFRAGVRGQVFKSLRLSGTAKGCSFDGLLQEGGRTQVTSTKTSVKRAGSWRPPSNSTARSWGRSSSLLMGIHHALLPASLPFPLLLASLGLSLPRKH